MNNHNKYKTGKYNKENNTIIKNDFIYKKGKFDRLYKKLVKHDDTTWIRSDNKLIAKKLNAKTYEYKNENI